MSGPSMVMSRFEAVRRFPSASAPSKGTPAACCPMLGLTVGRTGARHIHTSGAPSLRDCQASRCCPQRPLRPPLETADRKYIPSEPPAAAGGGVLAGASAAHRAAARRLLPLLPRLPAGVPAWDSQATPGGLHPRLAAIPPPSAWRLAVPLPEYTNERALWCSVYPLYVGPQDWRQGLRFQGALLSQGCASHFTTRQQIYALALRSSMTNICRLACNNALLAPGD